MAGLRITFYIVEPILWKEKNANLTYSGKLNAINLSFGDDLYTLFMVILRILRVVYGIGFTTLFLSSDY
jgi:hypothetical protein